MKVVIIGSGLIGKSWAAMFVKAGHMVALYDAQPGLADKAVADLQSSNPTLAAQFAAAADLRSALTGAGFVQECIPEILALKQTAFAQIDEALAANAREGDRIAETVVICSSSSNLGMSGISADMTTYASRCLVAHPVNPPTSIPLVELVPSPVTAPDALQTAYDVMKQIGQSPVILKKEVDGFVLNRLQYALLAEAVRLVQEGVCSPTDIDLCVTEGLARRWTFIGPFATIDLNAPGGTADYFSRYGDSIRGVIAQQDNHFEWKDETVQEIDREMRAFNGPVDGLPSRSAWRNERLDRLQGHLVAERVRDASVKK